MPLHFRATVEVESGDFLDMLGNWLKAQFPLDKFSHSVLKVEEVFHSSNYKGEMLEKLK